MRKPFATVAIATLLYASAPQAQVEETPSLRFNGFGTAGMVYSDEDQADFASTVLAPDGAGHTRRLSPEVDSRLGLQLTADLTPGSAAYCRWFPSSSTTTPMSPRSSGPT